VYASDLTDEERDVLSKLMPVGIKPGRPRKWSVRVMLNAIFYVEKAGCQWRQLSRDFPP
jgi:transposase